MTNGLTGCTENARVFLGNKPTMSKTRQGQDVAYFDVSWGVNEPESGKFGTWRHCIGYGNFALSIKDYRPGAYLKISGWVVTNPIYDKSGKREYIQGKPVTQEYLIISGLELLERYKPENQQLSLVGESTQ